MSDDKKSLGKAVRERIQANMDAQMAEQRRELFRKRLEMAKHGVDKFGARDAAKSASNFHTYIRVLEEYKGVPEGGLNPSHFDLKTEIPEILLLSGIYWDLVKLYDRTKSAERQKDFAHYLQQFIKFSKDLPHQHVSAETLRKYIATNRAQHPEELKNAYRILNNSKCFIASELIDVTDVRTIERLRDFRDMRLERSVLGGVSISVYYALAPGVAFCLRILPGSIRQFLGRQLDSLSVQIDSWN